MEKFSENEEFKAQLQDFGWLICFKHSDMVRPSSQRRNSMEFLLSSRIGVIVSETWEKFVFQMILSNLK